MKTYPYRTLRQAVAWAAGKMRQARLFFGHGTANARDEAMALALWAARLPWEVASDHWDRALTRRAQRAIFLLLQRRIKTRAPLAYLTKEARFAGMCFYVDRRVLIPRSPIAELIERRFSPWIHAEKVRRILDVGTGSGCIAIACAKAFPRARVDAVDVARGALVVARRNVERHAVTRRVALIQSDVFEALGRRRYDIIVSNPPYVSGREFLRLPKEYLHEPRRGLWAGSQGLDVVDRLLRAAYRHLRPGGILVVEVGYSAGPLMRRYPHLPFMWLEFSRGDSEVFLLTTADLT